MTPKSIFVSRKLEADSLLRQGLEKLDFHIVDEPLIRLTQIRFTHTPKADWIFFSSRNAIRFFFAQNPGIGPAVRFAVFGQGSAEVLREFGRKAEFIGTGNDATAIARAFISLLDGDIVLFPQAIDSMQTVQRWLPFNNIARNLFVYKTEARTDFDIPACELLLFTSPSNVNAYLSRHSISHRQKVIAIGTTTKLSLRSRAIHQAEVPKGFHESHILDLVQELYCRQEA